MMEPVNPQLMLLFFIVWISILLALGELIRRGLLRIGWDSLKVERIADKVIVNLFFGMIGIPFIVFLLTLAGYLLSFWSTFLVSILIIIGYAYISRDSLVVIIRRYFWKRPSYDSIIVFTESYWESIALFFIFLIAFIARAFIIPGLYAPLGGDARGWAWFCQRTVDLGGMTIDPGPDTYIHPSDPHRLLVGLPSLTAFFSFLFGLPVVVILLLTSSMVGSCVCFSMYYLVRRVTNDPLWALSSSFICALLAQSLFEYYSWGGNGEQFSYFLAPIMICILIGTENSFTAKRVLITSGILAICTFFHPFSLIYTICAVMPVIIWRVAKKRETKTWHSSLLTILILVSVGILLLDWGIIPTAATSAYIPEYWNWRVPFFTWKWNPFDPEFDWSLLWPNLVFEFGVRYQSAENVFLAFLAPLYIIFKYIQKKKLASRMLSFPLAWFSTLFMLHENHPAGIFFYEYPLWHFVYPHRVKLAFIFPIAFLGGAGLLFGFMLMKSIYHKFQTINRRKIRGVDMRPFAGGLISVIIGVAFFSALIAPDITSNVWNMTYAARRGNPIESADARAFEWIIQNVPENARFFTDEYDAGVFIPHYTGRKLIPPLVHFWTDIPDDLNALHEGFIDDPNSQRTLDILNKYNTTHIYIGVGRYYEWPPRFNAAWFLESEHYELLYMKDGVFIFGIEYF